MGNILQGYLKIYALTAVHNGMIRKRQYLTHPSAIPLLIFELECIHLLKHVFFNNEHTYISYCFW